MSIIGTLPNAISNGDPLDAVPVMADFNWIVSQVNGNAAGLGLANVFTQAQTFSAGINGVTTNSSAGTGIVGEYVEGIANNVAIGTSTQYQDTTTISLTAGDWDVSGDWQISTGSQTTIVEVGLSTGTAGNAFSDAVRGSNQFFWTIGAANTNVSASVSGWRVSIAVTTTVRMKTNLTYGGGTPSTFGRLSARRVR